ncbi:MAG: tRNA lysidine(34) synthetase TilS [Tenericutes bacterium]|nr:MAG: tRNA lysidine(34) synthetase TilS [Mycoplasmatota bacterium]
MINKLRKKVLVAVSGGPDSMYLLNKLNRKALIEPVAIHVNYNFRPESKTEEQLVSKFCKRNNIHLHIFNVTDKVLENYSMFKNKQHMAREIRYDFFVKASKLENTSIVYVGHHRDDFIETAIMQKEKSEDYLFYGIEKKTVIKGLTILRPLLKLYKDQLVVELENQDINYAIDRSNFDSKFERNHIRNKLLVTPGVQKEAIFFQFQKINSSRELKRKKLNKIYLNFVKSNYSRTFFMSLTDENMKNLIFITVSKLDMRINLSANKIESLIAYIKAGHGSKEFILMDGITLSMSKNQIGIKNDNR